MCFRLYLLPQVLGLAFVLPIAISAADRSRRPNSITHITKNQDTTDVTSLRGAIIEANRRGGHHTIILTCTNYELTLQGSSEDAALTGDLDITRGSLTIIG